MNGKSPHPVPRRTATIGMFLFLVALSMLFASGLLGYFVIRLAGANRPAAPTALQLPSVLWLSTAVLIASSFTIAAALRDIRAERKTAFRRNLLFTLALAATFLAVQIPALVQLVQMHWQMKPAGMPLYGMLFFLVLLHGLHVLGGVVMLAIVTVGAHRGQFDHEHHTAVRNTVWYWHFLDAVWLVMFLSLWTVA